MEYNIIHATKDNHYLQPLLFPRCNENLLSYIFVIQYFTVLLTN